MIRWTQWVSKFSTDAGDDVEVEYRDYHLPQTRWEPAEYEIEYDHLKINGVKYEGDIEEALEQLLSDKDQDRMFRRAELKNPPEPSCD